MKPGNKKYIVVVLFLYLCAGEANFLFAQKRSNSDVSEIIKACIFSPALLKFNRVIWNGKTIYLLVDNSKLRIDLLRSQKNDSVFIADLSGIFLRANKEWIEYKGVILKKNAAVVKIDVWGIYNQKPIITKTQSIKLKKSSGSWKIRKIN